MSTFTEISGCFQPGQAKVGRGPTPLAVSQSVRYRIFRLQASYLSATSHTGRKPCRVKSLYKKRFWPIPIQKPAPLWKYNTSYGTPTRFVYKSYDVLNMGPQRN
ncbi:MAG: hypothetical protein ACK55Z_05805, partial [bacterium]